MRWVLALLQQYAATNTWAAKLSNSRSQQVGRRVARGQRGAAGEGQGRSRGRTGGRTGAGAQQPGGCIWRLNLASR